MAHKHWIAQDKLDCQSAVVLASSRAADTSFEALKDVVLNDVVGALGAALQAGRHGIKNVSLAMQPSMDVPTHNESEDKFGLFFHNSGAIGLLGETYQSRCPSDIRRQCSKLPEFNVSEAELRYRMMSGSLNPGVYWPKSERSWPVPTSHGGQNSQLKSIVPELKRWYADRNSYWNKHTSKNHVCNLPNATHLLRCAPLWTKDTTTVTHGTGKTAESEFVRWEDRGVRRTSPYRVAIWLSASDNRPAETDAWVTCVLAAVTKAAADSRGFEVVIFGKRKPTISADRHAVRWASDAQPYPTVQAMTDADIVLANSLSLVALPALLHDQHGLFILRESTASKEALDDLAVSSAMSASSFVTVSPSENAEQKCDVSGIMARAKSFLRHALI